MKSASLLSVSATPQPASPAASESARPRRAPLAVVALLSLALTPSAYAQGSAPAAAAPAAAKAGSPDDAKETASCLVRTIHAVHEGSAFDAQLEPLKGQLKSPALSAWKSFKQIDKQDLTLPRHSPQSFNIPGEHRGSLQFLEKVEKEGKQRLRLRLELFDGAAKLLSTVVLIDNGGTMLQAGTKHAGGTLILGFTCQLKKP